MWRMLSRAPRLLIVLALASSIGLHWAFLQSVAWVTMVVSYSQTGSLKEALAKTFDGEHPCALCNHIADGKKSEKKAELQFEVKKLEFPCLAGTFVFGDRRPYGPIAGPLLSARPLTYSPPVPPPRSVI